jgi:hypothetical protein
MIELAAALPCYSLSIDTCTRSMNLKTVAEVKQIARQLGEPGSPGIKVEVHKRIGVEVSA